MLNNRQEIINAFKTSIFPYIDGFQIKEESEEVSEEESEEESDEELDENKFFKDIENESEGISYDLFKTHFNFLVSATMAKRII